MTSLLPSSSTLVDYAGWGILGCIILGIIFLVATVYNGIPEGYDGGARNFWPAWLFGMVTVALVVGVIIFSRVYNDRNNDRREDRGCFHTNGQNIIASVNGETVYIQDSYVDVCRVP